MYNDDRMLTNQQHLTDTDEPGRGRQAILSHFIELISLSDAVGLYELASRCFEAIQELEDSGDEASAEVAEQIGFLQAIAQLAESICKQEPSKEARRAVRSRLRGRVFEAVRALNVATPTDVAKFLGLKDRQSAGRALRELAEVGVLRHWEDVGFYSLDHQGVLISQDPPWLIRISRSMRAITDRLNQGPTHLEELANSVVQATLLPLGIATDVTQAILRELELMGVVTIDVSEEWSIEHPSPAHVAQKTIEFVRDLLKRPIRLRTARTQIRRTIGLDDQGARELTSLIVSELMKCELAVQRGDRLKATAMPYALLPELIAACFEQDRPEEVVSGDSVEMEDTLRVFDERLSSTRLYAFQEGLRKGVREKRLAAKELRALEGHGDD
jgi:hypothetical protein